MLRDELDMLEFRLAHMEDHEVGHVIVEAPRNHRGDPKGLFYANSEYRFSRWHDRIVRVRCDHLPGREADCGPWLREHLQRDCARETILALAAPDDLVLLADVDEIPDMSLVSRLRPGRPATLRQRVFAFAVDWEFPYEEATSVLCPAGWLRESAPSAVRDSRHMYDVVHGAGWHFSWLGGSAEIRRKVAAHCHEEQDRALLDGADSGALYRDGVGIWGFNLLPVDVDESYPELIRSRKCPANWFRPRKEAA
jgi:hypothetical protein